MFRTTEATTIKSYLDVIEVPKGTRVIPIKGGGNEISYALTGSVLDQQNEHDRKYHYVCVPRELVEEIK